MKNFLKILSYCLIFISFSCNSNQDKKRDEVPSWYIKQGQNNTENLYGVASGNNMEEATRFALTDAAARLMTSISSNSSAILEENKHSINEEFRQKISQNIEKIDFGNFQISNSAKIGGKFFVEVKIERDFFVRDQKERLGFLEKKVSNLENDLVKANSIQKRNSLIEILNISKEIELKSRILSGAGESINLKEKLDKIASFEDQLAKFSNNIEFYFDDNSPQDIAKIIRTSLNKQKLKISQNRNSSNQNQILIKIRSNINAGEVYGSFISKLNIDFENYSSGKILASSRIEVSGSSAIDKKQAYFAALKSLEEQIENEGILKVIGIIN